MPVRAIINGFYRSGTTLLWKMIDSGWHGGLCLYEPDHPNLSYHLRMTAHDSDDRALHGYPVWRTYYALEPEVRERMQLENPFAVTGVAAPPPLVREYVRVADSSAHPIVLQTNRLHFALDAAALRDEIKLVHIVRRPDDVYRSIDALYQYSAPVLKRIAKSIARPLLRPRAFHLDEMAQQAEAVLGTTARRGVPGTDARTLLPRSFMENFTVAWILGNWAAMRAVDRKGGMIVDYDELIGFPKETTSRLAAYLGIDLEHSVIRRPKERIGSSRTFWRRFQRIADRYGIRSELEAIAAVDSALLGDSTDTEVT